MLADYTPRLRHAAFAIWARNMLVWRKMIGSSVVINLGEPLLYLVAFGYGLGMFIGGAAARWRHVAPRGRCGSGSWRGPRSPPRH